MAANAQKGCLLDPGGGVVGPDPKGPMCRAYETALHAWCSKKPGKRGDFNDVVFKKLKDRSLAAKRELPVGFLEKGKRVARGLEKLSRKGDAKGAAATQLLQEIRNATALESSGWCTWLYRSLGAATVRGAMGAQGVDIERVLVPDALRPPDPGTPVEIKRPTEEESHDGQLRNDAKASPNGQCELVNCAACELSCATRKVDCPSPPYASKR